MKRVAFFSGDITRSGGTERVGTIIANELAKSQEYKVFFISLTHQKETPFYPIEESISLEYFSEKWIHPGIGYLPVIWRLVRFLRKKRIDILIDIDGVLDVISIPAKCLTRVTLISWEHFNYYADLGTSYRKIIRKMAARHADAIVTLTEQDRKYYCDNLKIRHKICAIHNPVDYMNTKEEAMERKYSNKVILSVGRLTQMKGFRRVPAMAARLREKYPKLSFQWLIVGEGEQRSLIEAEIEKWDVQDSVRLLGHIEDVSEFYEKALLYVMTSEYEGLPMVLLEAKMHRLPCVSFDIKTGPSEIIQDGKDGYLIPYETEKDYSEDMVDAIAKLLTEEETYRRFVNHTQDNIDEFRLSHVMEKWFSLLEMFPSSSKLGRKQI